MWLADDREAQNHLRLSIKLLVIQQAMHDARAESRAASNAMTPNLDVAMMLSIPQKGLFCFVCTCRPASGLIGTRELQPGFADSRMSSTKPML